MTTALRAAGLALLALLAISPAAYAARDDLLFASRGSGPSGAPGNEQSFNANLSGDGRFLAFASSATNLDAEGQHGIFVRNLLTDELVRASRGSDGSRASGASYWPWLSRDGRRISFVSTSLNLEGGSTEQQQGYLRDLDAGTTALVSRRAGASGAPGNGVTFFARTSPDASVVAVDSNATNLIDGLTGSFRRVFVRTMSDGGMELVSRASGADGALPDGASADPSISADNRYVAFQSSATNLVPGDTNGRDDVFVRDRNTGTTALVSRATGASGTPGAAGGFLPRISRNGRFVAFTSFSGFEGPTSGAQVWVRDLYERTTTFVSRATGAAGAPANDGSYLGGISDDGRYVAFASSATNLSDEDDDASRDIFVRDRLSNTTTLVSRAAGAAGAGADEHSDFDHSISGSGRRVGFASAAMNLSDADGDAHYDVFMREVLDPIAPESVTPPRIDGVPAAIGRELRCVGAAWSAEPERFEHSWRRNGSAIAGATAATYTVTAADTGARLSCVASAVNVAGRTDAESAAIDGPPAPGSTPPPAAGGAAPRPPLVALADQTAPVITGAAFAPARFRVGGPRRLPRSAPRGSTLRFTLSEPARVSVAIVRRTAGLRRGSRCAASTPALRARLTRGLTAARRRARLRRLRCVAKPALGRLALAAAAGRNAVPFGGRVSGRAARAGQYEATLTAVDAAGNRSRAFVVRFRVVRR